MIFGFYVVDLLALFAVWAVMAGLILVFNHGAGER